MRRLSIFAVLLAALAVSAIVGTAAAATKAIDFETYALGSIQGQDGWAGSGSVINPLYDQAIVANGVGVPASFGTQSWRFSNAVTTGNFSDQPYSPSLTDEAGETTAQNGGMSGGTRQTYFQAQWDFTSADPSGQQIGLQIATSADRGDGARMSYVRVEDRADGLAVVFRDYQDVAPFGTTLPDPNGCAATDMFVDTTIASGLSRGAAHTLRIGITFVDGPRNDIVKAWVDGTLAHTGTSWEDFFRYCDGTPPRTVDSLLFRSAGVAAPTLAGDGFLFDNMSYLSSSPPCSTVCYVDGATGNDANSGANPAEAKKTIQGGVDAVDVGGTVIVAAGTYAEHVDINKAVDLLGANAGIAGDAIRGAESIVDGGLTDAPLTISADDVLIDGFKITGGENGGNAGVHIFSNNWAGWEIVNNVVTGNAIGVEANCVSDCAVAHNLFDANNEAGAVGGAGLYAEVTNGLSVASNVFTGHTENNPVIFAASNPSAHVDLTFTNNELNNTFGMLALGVDGGLFQGNTIQTDNQTAFTLGGGNAHVDVLKNVLKNNLRGLRVADFGFLSSLAPNSDIEAHRNNVAGDATYGIGVDNVAGPGYVGTLSADCNWWGSFTGPGPVGSGSGSNVTADVAYSPWLQSSNLDGECSPNGNITIILQTHPEGSKPFSFTGTNGISPFTLVDDGSIANTKSFSVPPGIYTFRVAAVSKWALISLRCDSHQTILKSHRLVQIQLHSDEDVTCTFTESHRIPDAMIALASGGPYSGDNIYSGSVLPSQTLSQSFAAGETKSFFVKFQNDGLDPDGFRVVSKLKGSLKYKVVFMAGTTEITGKVNAGTYRFKLAPGATRMIEIRVIAGPTITTDVRNIVLTMQSRTAPAAKDVVKAFVNAGP